MSASQPANQLQPTLSLAPCAQFQSTRQVHIVQSVNAIVPLTDIAVYTFDLRPVLGQ